MLGWFVACKHSIPGACTEHTLTHSHFATDTRQQPFYTAKKRNENTTPYRTWKNHPRYIFIVDSFHFRARCSLEKQLFEQQRMQKLFCNTNAKDQSKKKSKLD